MINPIFNVRTWGEAVTVAHTLTRVCSLTHSPFFLYCELSPHILLSLSLVSISIHLPMLVCLEPVPADTWIWGPSQIQVSRVSRSTWREPRQTRGEHVNSQKGPGTFSANHCTIVLPCVGPSLFHPIIESGRFLVGWTKFERMTPVHVGGGAPLNYVNKYAHHIWYERCRLVMSSGVTVYAGMMRGSHDFPQ